MNKFTVKLKRQKTLSIRCPQISLFLNKTQVETYNFKYFIYLSVELVTLHFTIPYHTQSNAIYKIDFPGNLNRSVVHSLVKNVFVTGNQRHLRIYRLVAFYSIFYSLQCIEIILFNDTLNETFQNLTKNLPLTGVFNMFNM